MTVRLAAILACLMASMALAPAALAQARDLKDWGGPPNMGIDFKTGQSYGVTDIGAAQPGKPKRKRVVRARVTGKAATKTAKPAEKPSEKSENKTAATAPEAPETKPAAAEMKPTAGKAVVETGTVSATPSKPVPCRKFDPTTGRTIEVRCR